MKLTELKIKHLKVNSSMAFCCCSVTKSCLPPCNAMNCSTPGLAVLHYLLELASTHVHWVSEAFQPSHPLLPPHPIIRLLLLPSIFPIIRVFSMSQHLLHHYSVYPSPLSSFKTFTFLILKWSINKSPHSFSLIPWQPSICFLFSSI